MTTRYRVHNSPPPRTHEVPSRVCTDGGSSLSVDDAFAVLANPARRHALTYLRREGSAVDRTELARYVAARELECDLVEVPADALERAEIDLYHLALPSLRAHGLVEYSEGAVVLLEDDPTIARLLDAAEAAAPW
ncbi:ArsR family transcriptional regulator [Natrinema sp. 1APR25-10V2]|uniref:DUF7344 domain-containing protein n=1 Tax=Natrinema sp. 1APR25-10V2 TaxID=2951081 RepID=UPI00287595FE|nr:ArsR family transcriptional regulator [Natrinema sp. 1APR25-10V2]MDS0476725.1 ArsR family transcriptional regulator [Natrinema sp. 1APR25-10V2]